MAMWPMALVFVAPCQCFTPGGVHTTSPVLMVCLALPASCTHPIPLVTMSSWPAGCVCHTECVPGSKVTDAAVVLVDGAPGNSGSTRPKPEKSCARTLPDGCVPFG